VSARVDHTLRFLRDEAWFNSWRASVDRAKFYSQRHEKRIEEKSKLKCAAEEYLKERRDNCYQTNCSEASHLDNIGELVALFNKHDIAGRNKYGSAQKLLNVYLKYLWCFRLINDPPPHCPVDRIIISKTNLANKVNWTEIANQEEYMMVINEISSKAKASDISIAQWELENYSPRIPGFTSI
jgi:hypothetical protein